MAGRFDRLDSAVSGGPVTGTLDVAGVERGFVGWAGLIGALEEARAGQGGGEVVVRLQLGSSDPLAARGLVAMRDLDAGTPVVRSAARSPHARRFGTGAAVARQPTVLQSVDGATVLGLTLLDQAVLDELPLCDPEVVAVAAIARAVDARMLAAVLPGTDGNRAAASLRELSFAERLGTRVTLPARVRTSVRATLVAEDTAHASELRRRIADHVHARAVLGEQRLIFDLAELIDDDSARWRVAAPVVGHHLSRPARGDDELIARRLGAAGSAWWAGIRRWFAQAPEQVGVIRNGEDRIEGLAVWVTPASAPAWVGEDAVVGPWLAHAAANGLGQDVIMLRECLDLGSPGQRRSPATSARNHHVLQSCDLVNARYVYSGVRDGDTAGLQLAAEMGYQAHPGLDVLDGDRWVRCFVRDWGPSGALGLLRDAVYREIGLAPPAAGPTAEVAAASVREALRCYQRPTRLAGSPLARGGTVHERAASVRRLLRDAVQATFGDSASERQLHAIVVRGYLDADGGHDRAQLDLHVSRTTYFRQLSEASERVTAHLLAVLR